MKLLVFPSRRREQVEAVVRAALADERGTDDLTLTIVRLSQEWTVKPAGLGDELRERRLCELAKQALKKADV